MYRLSLAALVLVLGGAACTPNSWQAATSKPEVFDTSDSPTPGPDPYAVEVGPYAVEVRWTEFGVPHIQAADEGSLGYGMGYAFARDHYCTLIDQIVMVNSERSKFLGRGDDDIHVHTDFGWLALGVKRQAEEGWFRLDPAIQDRIVGYAAGVNRYVNDHDDPFPDGRCAGAPYLRDINHIDLLAYYLAFGLKGSGGVFVDAIGSAAPPDARPAPPPPAERTLARVREPGMGSNGWAIGSDLSATGGGMLLSNTHFPAVGERKWHESHLTIPGRLDVYGASLMGVPAINVGFNADVAWTHTVSGAPRFVAYLLTLEEGQPTRYNSRGVIKDMEAVPFQIEVLGDDGTRSVESRTLYRTDFGWVMNAPVVGWTPLNAFALRDANENNLEMLPTWFAINQARSMAELQAAHAEHLGIPWVHTIAASKEGEVWTIDSGAVPNWSAETYAAWQRYTEEQVLAGLFADYGVFVANAADPAFDWVEAPGARAAGLIPYADMPQLSRRDFVFNANDNHWLSNPSAPLEGYNALYGPERTARSPRTRMNALYLTERGPDAMVGADDRLSLAELEGAALGGRGMLATLLRADVAARCLALPSPVTVTIEDADEVVDLGPACAALGSWGGTTRLDDPGAPLWRELVNSGVYEDAEGYSSGRLFAEGFDPERPVQTPAGLAAGADADAALAQALGLAVARLARAGLGPDSTLRAAQFMPIDDARIPVPGGTDREGVIQISTWSSGSGTLLTELTRAAVVNPDSDLTTEGYAINYGNSWVMAMEFGADGPSARAVLTYSQSEVEGSAHRADQTAVYGQEQLRPVRFSAADIDADPTLQTLRLTLD